MIQDLPFSNYPYGGRKPLGRRRGLITRTVDGPEFMRITGTRHCAYCGLDMTKCYKDWLTMALDHVVPVSVCTKMGICVEWVWDYSNCVLACGACNGFCNRYQPQTDCSIPPDLPRFYDLRDRIFRERYLRVAERSESERLFFESKPWDPDFQQIVLEVGGEGGSVSIHRQRNQKGVWEYWAICDETTISELLTKDDLGNDSDLLLRPTRVNKFQKALDSLRFPWFRLIPLKVHPELAGLVLREVAKKGGIEAATIWTERLSENQPRPS